MQLFDHLPTPAVHLDSDGRILNVNSLARSLFGWQNTAFEGLAFSQSLTQEDASLFNKAYSEVSEGQTLVFNATLLVDPEHPIPVTIKASKTDSGDRIFLLNRQDTYTNGCGEKCLHAAILEAQYQHNPGGILLVNREREMISFNNEFVKMWGIPPEILESRDEGASLRYALEKTNDPKGFLAKVHALYETPDAESTDEIHLKDSRVFYRQTYPAFRDSEYLGRVWYFLDITPLKNAQYQLENQQIYLNAILQHVQDGIIACDAEGRLSLFNRASRELFAKSKTEPMPETLSALHSFVYEDGASANLEKDPLTRALAGATLKNDEMVIVSKEGKKHALHINGQAMYDSEGNKLGAVVSLHDITDLKKAKDQLRFMAYHDALTNLPNRRLFHDLLEQSLKHAHRNHQQVGVLFLDLDNFKTINDRHGHDVGDQLLVLIAKTLRTCLRDSDIICRWGGDEFVIGLLATNATDEVIAVAEKICAKVLENISKKDTTFQMSVSVGIAMYPAHGTEPDLLIRNADMAMYRAKRLGKNRCELFLPKDSG